MIKIGLVGCGWIVKNAHMPVLKKFSEVEIAAVYDINETKAKIMAETYDIKNIYDVYDKFLESDIDAIIICTPNYTHKDLSIKAMRHGKSVLCEKPIALSYNDVKKIKECANEEKCIFVPGFVNRFRYDINCLKKILENSHEQVLRVEAKWKRQNGIPRMGSWFTSKKYSGGGVLIDIGPHILDVCCYIINDFRILNVKDPFFYYEKTDKSATWIEEQKEDYMEMDVETGVKGGFFTANGYEVDFELDWNNSTNRDFTQFAIYTENRIIELNTLFGFSNNSRWSTDTIIVKQNDKSEQVYSRKHNSIDFLEPFELLYKYFFSCIKKGNKGNLTIDHALSVATIIDNTYKKGM